MNIRFGKFELDSRRYELTCEGRRIKLERIPMKLLFYLSQSKGALVSREDIAEHLWGKDVFVDAQHSVNTAINKLRTALRDDLADPKFIKTVKGMGYRFVAEVEISATDPPVATFPPAALTPPSNDVPEAAEAVAARPAAAEMAARDFHSPGSVSLASEAVRSAGSPIFYKPEGAPLWTAAGGGAAALEIDTIVSPVWLSRRAMLGFALLLVTILTASGAYYYDRFRSGSQLTDKDTIVLVGFNNSTGNSVFDDTLKTALRVSLRQSPFLNVLPESQFAKTLKLMELPSEAKLTPEKTRDLCQRVGSKAYVAGSIASLGSQYVVGLKAVNCRNGDLLAEEQATATSREDVLDALGRTASKLRSELGESLATVQKFDVPLQQATTPSLEALQAYSKGYSKKVTAAEGISITLRAIELDPNFAMAYADLGEVYSERGEIARSREFHTKAFQLRDHASEREKLEIAGEYYQYVTGQLDLAARSYEEEVESYTGAAYLNLGNVYGQLGDYEKAAKATEEFLRRAPDNAGTYVNLANFALAQQRFDQARQIIQNLQSRGKDPLYIHPQLYALAFFKEDHAAMAEQERLMTLKPEDETYGLEMASDTEAYFGHLSKARELSQRAADAAIRADEKENAAVWLAIAAQREAAYGNVNVARRQATAALQLFPASEGVESEAALALAMAGDTPRAESLSRELQKIQPQGTQMQSIWLASIRAQLDLGNGKPAAAIDVLQTTPPIDFGQILFVMNVSCLYPVYLRGQAYLANGQGGAAATEFQKILDHNGMVWNCWTGAVAHLGVARANALESRKLQGVEADAAHARALAAYREFFTLWKDADPDIPALKAAKAEYASLQ